MRRKRSAEPTHQVAEGIATVGVFLLRGSDGSATHNQFCTASTVASGSKSLVVTAAHCLKGSTSLRNAAFVPGYRAGGTKAGQAGEMPYGIFPVQDGKVWIDHRYQRARPTTMWTSPSCGWGPTPRASCWRMPRARATP